MNKKRAGVCGGRRTETGIGETEIKKKIRNSNKMNRRFLIFFMVSFYLFFIFSFQ